MNERIAIIGAGELGKQILHLANKNGYNVTGFFDDYCKEYQINGKTVLGGINNICNKVGEYDSVVVAIGYKHMNVRNRLYTELKLHGIKFATIIDKT